MKKEFVVTEVAKVKYLYTVQATSKREAVEKVLNDSSDAKLYDVEAVKNWKPVAVLGDEVPEEL
jgi:hypothetical protein